MNDLKKLELEFKQAKEEFYNSLSFYEKIKIKWYNFKVDFYNKFLTI